jgi:hypothetical protein
MTISEINPDERRGDRRRRTLLLGRIFDKSAGPALECDIRDLSDLGACLRGAGVANAPDRFQLEIPSRNRLHGARVRWRSGDRIGVDFETDAVTPP